MKRERWIPTELSCYSRGAQTRRHIRQWGTENVLGHPDPAMVGHWVEVRVLSSGRRWHGVVVGRMGRVPPSRHSRCTQRVLDIALAGWRKQFPGRAPGVVDVEYRVEGKVKQ